jgi:phosphatidylinositol alpha-1,6-mannosyltransferase
MARRHVELCRRIAQGDDSISVSTVQLAGAAEFDRDEPYPIHRQPFHFREANRLTSQMKWARWLTGYCRNRIDLIHCGNIRPVGYSVQWASTRLGIPYLVYVNGGDLLRERRKAQSSRLKKVTARRILGGAAGIVATSRWVAELSSAVMEQVGVRDAPPVVALDLGTDPIQFHPAKDTGRVRREWGLTDEPVLLTVARLVPHKGQDSGIRATAALRSEFPRLRYVLVGEGHDEGRLRSLASDLGVSDCVVFAGAIADSDLPEAYATATIYLGASRLDEEINVEGFGISFLEAAASGVPVVAGDSGGVRSAVRDGETGVVVPPENVEMIVNALAGFLRDDERRRKFGDAGRRAVETHYNWDRVARDTRAFAAEAVERWKRK